MGMKIRLKLMLFYARAEQAIFEAKCGGEVGLEVEVEGARTNQVKYKTPDVRVKMGD